MSITWNNIKNQIASALGNIAGVTVATADTNYVATISDSTLISPDFTKTMIEDAAAGALGEIVEAIASTPGHPEREDFADITDPLANLDQIPRAGSAGGDIIGVYGFVRDASDGQACVVATLDEVRSYNRFPSIYAGADAYRYVINGNRIEHTRTAVIIEVCTYTRPVTFTAVPLADWHESGLVHCAVRRIALKESMFKSLYESANTGAEAHLEEIRSYKP